jgi:hypothetical protein
MFLSSTLQSMVLLGVLTGLPKLPHFSFRKPPRPAPTAADSLPLPWKTASRLTLESQIVRAGLPGRDLGLARLQVQGDPRRLRVALEPDSGMISAVTEVGEYSVAPAARAPLASYAELSARESFRRQWVKSSQHQLSTVTAGAAAAAAPHSQGLSFQFPSPLPAKIQSLLGPGGPQLNVSGSENIKLSGQSTWSNQQNDLAFGQKRSLFPSLDMQQDLNIRLEGRLSDRIGVNLLQNSINPIPLSNRIAINYAGDEDDLVQAFDLGNTSLTLPNTQYVSYSGRNEGLFGAKTALRYGSLDLTMLATKQEGRSERSSYAGGASKQSRPLADMDYIRGTYYFLYDPNNETQLIDESSIRVFKDDYNYGNLSNKQKGRALVDPRLLSDPAHQNDPSVKGSFALLNPGPDKDYEILNDTYGPLYKIIRLRGQMTGEQRLAVTYRYHPNGDPASPLQDMGGQDADTVSERPMKLLRAPASVLKADSLDLNVFDNDPVRSPFSPTRDLELRNFYDLSGQRIDPLTLKISIRRGQVDPPVTTVSLADGTPVPYLEVLGLDNLDESGSSPVKGHDLRVDGTLINSNTRLFVDYENGILFFPELRPFAPRVTGADAKPFEQRIDAQLNRRAALTGSLGEQNAPNTNVYERYNPQRNIDSRYFIDVEFTAQRQGGDIYLGRSNLVEGSDVVTINGQPLVRDRDYTVDYELGRVTLKRQLGPTDNLNIDYSYAPLFQQAGRTLLGSAFKLQGRSRNLGGAFMYESKGAQDLRPRLGEEPSRSVIGDLNTTWDLKPDWITRMVDRMPGVRTTAPSEMHVQAEVGMSFPNPNTSNEVFVDDMEGVRDAVSLAMTGERWHWSSAPSLWYDGRAHSVLEPGNGVQKGIVDTLKNTEVHWYTLYKTTQEKDLKPNLTTGQGSQSYRQVLAISLPRRPRSAPQDTSLWAGITYPLDVAGLDISRSQFIELWVNDWNDQARVRDRHVRLHIDLGTVGEDEMRSPDVPPDTVLQSEDKAPRDNQLTVTDQNNEDTGYDGLTNEQERAAGLPILDLTTANSTDPRGDDFRTDQAQFNEPDPRRSMYVNGTEGNKARNPNPDTEDLNLNGILDNQEDYLEYTIDLGDTTYLVTDVQRESQLGRYPPVPSDNGWRRFRIPLNDPRAVRFGSPNLTLARDVRVWLQGVVDVDPPIVAPAPGKPFLMLGSVDIVGSRWQAVAISKDAVSAGTTQTLNAVNNLDNADIYRPPFAPGQTRNGNQEVTRREQSIALEFTQLHPRGTLAAFKTFSIDEDYSRYGSLNWYVAGYNVPGHLPDDSLRYFVRFSSDEIERNYYEYRAPVPPSSPARDPARIVWENAVLTITDMSNLKLNSDYKDNDTVPYRYQVPNSQVLYLIKGRPSFTRLRRVSFGLVNQDTSYTFPEGQLWFNELRATDIAKDVDKAGRMMVTGNVANVMRYNLSLDGRGADFLTVGQSRGSGNSVRSVNFGGSVDLHRFFEGTGIVMPANFSYTDNSSKPRFTAGDDVVRIGALSEASKTQATSRNWGISYNRVWGDRSNPILRFWLSGITASLNGGKGTFRNPNAIGTSSNLGGAVSYSITPRRYLPLTVPGTRLRIYPLPERTWWNYTLGTTQGHTIERLRDGTLGRTLGNVNGRNAGIDFGADTRPIDLLHHHIEGHRNLTLPEPLLQQVGFINFGRVVRWSQSMDAHYTLNRGQWLRPTFGWNAAYNQGGGPELSPDLSVRAISNGQTLRMNWDLPFERLPIRVPAPGDTGRVAAPALWRRVLSHLGTVSADAQFNQSSNFSRVVGMPSFVYLFGLSSDPGFENPTRVEPQYGNTYGKGEDWRSGVRTRLALLYGATINVRGDFAASHNLVNGVVGRRGTQHFPSVEFDYGRVAHAIRLDRLLKNPTLRTSYDRARTTDYLINTARPSVISTSADWRPLLGVTGELKNGTRTDLQIERRVTQDENHTLGNSLKTTRNTNLRLSMSRSYTQGQKVNFLGKQSTVRSTVGLGLNATYSRNSGEIKIFNRVGRPSGTQSPFEDDRLAVNTTGSYGFSSNVTGNLLLGFGQDRDLQRAVVRRNVLVELRASFTF